MTITVRKVKRRVASLHLPPLFFRLGIGSVRNSLIIPYRGHDKYILHGVHDVGSAVVSENMSVIPWAGCYGVR